MQQELGKEVDEEEVKHHLRSELQKVLDVVFTYVT
jgi:hypothetical protein